MLLYRAYFAFDDGFTEFIPILVSNEKEARVQYQHLYYTRRYEYKWNIVDTVLCKAKLSCKSTAIKAQLKHRFIPMVKKCWRPLLSKSIEDAFIISSTKNSCLALGVIYLTPDLHETVVAHEFGHYLFFKLKPADKTKVEKAVVMMCEKVTDIDAVILRTQHSPKLYYLYSTLIDAYTILNQVHPESGSWEGHKAGYGHTNKLYIAANEAFAGMCQLIFVERYEIPEELSDLHRVVTNILKRLKNAL